MSCMKFYVPTIVARNVNEEAKHCLITMCYKVLYKYRTVEK